MPTANQTTNRIQVVLGRDNIKASEEMAPIGATNHTQGVLNRRGNLGSRTRRTKTPADTMMKADKVPMLQRFPASSTVNTAPKKATTTPVTMVMTQGVLNRGCTVLTN